MEIDYVQTIEQTPFKTGVGKNGKDWALYGVTTKSGKKGSTFDGDLITGDQVVVKQNGDYTNISRATAKATEEVQEHKKTDELLELVKDNNRMLKLLVGDGDSDTSEAPTEPDFGDM